MLDRHHHAVDERADHPIGVLRAQCGHTLMTTRLHDIPQGPACPACAASQLAALPVAADPAYVARLRRAGQRPATACWVLGQVIALADDAPGLSATELRLRLAALAGRAQP